MSTVDGHSAPGGSPSSEPADLKLEAVVLPAGDLAAALHRAESAPAEHEKRIGPADSGWPDWHAEYTVPEQSGKELPV
jgi:hypothetical protein